MLDIGDVVWLTKHGCLAASVGLIDRGGDGYQAEQRSVSRVTAEVEEQGQTPGRGLGRTPRGSETAFHSFTGFNREVGWAGRRLDEQRCYVQREGVGRDDSRRRNHPGHLGSVVQRRRQRGR